jgi:hypothetical protein
MKQHVPNNNKDEIMAKKNQSPKVQDKESAFELIEMAIDDVELLTRAFDVITKACEEAQKSTTKSHARLNQQEDKVLDEIPELMLH